MLESIWRWITIAAVCFLAITSYWHIARNAFIPKDGAEDSAKLRLHKIAMALFGVVVVVYVAGVIPSIVTGVVIVGFFVLLIHGFRTAIDVGDGKDSTTLHVAVRHVIDAAANFLTLVFVIAVDARHDVVLAWPALLLSAGLIGKELYYRFWLDSGPRGRNPRKTAQGRPGTKTSKQFAGYHALSNGFKSFAYFIAGYAALYLCLGTISPRYNHLIFNETAGSRFGQAFTFSARNIQLVLGGQFDAILFVLMLLEFGGAFFLLLGLSQTPLNRN